MAKWTQDGDTFTLHDTATVNAPIDRCFQLTCSVALVREELGMKPVTGRVDGLVRHGDEIRWEGWQLGLKHYHVTQISKYDRPVFMQDSMLAGRFRSFQHDHHLRELAAGTGTQLEDELRFSLPLGWAGQMVAKYIMIPHILKLMRSRFARIKRIAEGDAWQQYLPDEQTASHA
jgi:ligand-binding SRPBCC domain-containing protein